MKYHEAVEETRGKKSDSYRLTERSSFIVLYNYYCFDLFVVFLTVKEIKKEIGGIVEDAKGRQVSFPHYSLLLLLFFIFMYFVVEL
jgi:hypothetical protein